MFSKYYIPFVVWALLILLIIAVPGAYIPKPHGIWEIISPDKIIHLAMFTPLSYLSSWGVYKESGHWNLSIIFAVVFGISYAIGTELLQYFVISGRNGNIYDAIADIVGVFIGIIVFKSLQNKTVY